MQSSEIEEDAQPGVDAFIDVLRLLTKGFYAGDPNIRQTCIQIMKQFITIGTLELALPDEEFQDIEEALVERLKDKNSGVRTAAC